MKNAKVYSIHNPSQELLIKTIKTIPKEPVNGYIQFSAEGINWKSFSDKDLYARTCERKNIIPYSSMVFNRGFAEGNLTFSYDQANNLEKYFSGSRIESYLFNLSNVAGLGDYHKNSGARLRKISELFLPNLMENNYEISKFDFWLGSFISNARHGNHSPKAILNLNESNNNILSFVVGPDYLFEKENDLLEKIPEIEKWFSSLQERILF